MLKTHVVSIRPWILFPNFLCYTIWNWYPSSFTKMTELNVDEYFVSTFPDRGIGDNVSFSICHHILIIIMIVHHLHIFHQPYTELFPFTWSSPTCLTHRNIILIHSFISIIRHFLIFIGRCMVKNTLSDWLILK